MKKHKSRLDKARLFDGIDASDRGLLLKSLDATVKAYLKDAVILLAGSPVIHVGVLLSGTGVVVKENADGSQSIVAKLTQGDLFGEVFACAGITECPVTVLASSDCEVLFVAFEKIAAGSQPLVANLFRILAEKNRILNFKIELLSKRTIRDKMLFYLSDQMRQTGRAQFDIPFDRSGLADYFCVDRSALSRELCRMREEGMIQFDKKKFTVLIQPDAFEFAEKNKKQ